MYTACRFVAMFSSNGFQILYLVSARAAKATPLRLRSNTAAFCCSPMMNMPPPPIQVAPLQPPPAGQQVDRDKIYQWIVELASPETRENALLELRCIVDKQTCHNFVARIRIFWGKIRINPYHCNIPDAKHRNNARNTVLLFITGAHK